MKQLKCWTQVFVKSLGEALGCIFGVSDQASSNMFMVHQPRKASAMIISKLHGTQVTPIFVQPTQRCCSSDSFTNLKFRIYDLLSIFSFIPFCIFGFWSLLARSYENMKIFCNLLTYPLHRLKPNT